MNSQKPDQPVLEVSNLSISLTPKNSLPIQIIDHLNFSVKSGERLAIVGESGSGKTVTAMAIMQLLEGAHYQGAIRFLGEDLLKKSERELQEIRGSKVALTFQDSLSTLNPIMKIGEQITEVLTIRGIKKTIAKDRALTLLSELGFEKPLTIFNHYPHQFSGGMRQRVMMAIALIANPQVLIADEPTTALDVRIQAQVMCLLNDLTERKHLTVILISHDMGVVAGFADRVIVMYSGRIVEQGEAEEIFYKPQHPYTRALLESIPTVNRDPSNDLPLIKVTTTEPKNRPFGCVFQDRCAQVQERCKVMPPEYTKISVHHEYACFFPGNAGVA
jgi:oligopeptide/dipeptide ABC transporter ATP-binding protein